jgi:ubiquitin carboxyl-terminal hydrolase 9/13
LIDAGVCTSTTTCRSCGGKTSRTESFFEVSLEITADCSSVAECLRRYAAPEVLEKANGFHCESEMCAKAGLQPAEKRMELTKLPKVLVLHLKRFQYHVAQQRFVKLLHRVSFGAELKIWDSGEPDVLFKLKGVCVHIGRSAESGERGKECKEKNASEPEYFFFFFLS